MTRAGPFNILGQDRAALEETADDAWSPLPQELWPVEYAGLEELAAIKGGATESCTVPARGANGMPVAQAIGGPGLALVIPLTIEEGDVMFFHMTTPGAFNGGLGNDPLYWYGWHPLYYAQMHSEQPGNAWAHMCYYRVAEAADAGKMVLTSDMYTEGGIWRASLRAYVCGGPGVVVRGDGSLAYAVDYSASRQVNFFGAHDLYADFSIAFVHDQGGFPLVVGGVANDGAFINRPEEFDVLGPAMMQPGCLVAQADEQFTHDQIQTLYRLVNIDIPGSFTDPDTGLVMPMGSSVDTSGTSSDGSFGRLIVPKTPPADGHFTIDSFAIALRDGTSSPPTPQAFTLVRHAAPGPRDDWTVPDGEGPLTVSGGVLTTADASAVEIYSVHGDNAAPYAYRGDKYAAYWSGMGPVGDHHKIRMRFKQSYPGTSYVPRTTNAVVVNMADRTKGLTFWFALEGVGWTTHLSYVGNTEFQFADTFPTPIYQQNFDALVNTRDTWAKSFGIPGLFWYPRDYPPSPTRDFWIEIWRHGTTYTAWIYVNDPEIYPPVYESHHTVASDDPDYGPSVAGYFGWARDFLTVGEGLAEVSLFAEA